MNAMSLRQFPGSRAAGQAGTAPTSAKTLINDHRRASAALNAAKAAYSAVQEPFLAFIYNGRPYWLGSLEAIDQFADSIRPKDAMGKYWSEEIDQKRDRFKAQLQAQIDSFDAAAAAQSEIDYDVADEAHDAALWALIKHVPADLAEVSAMSQYLLFLMNKDQISEGRLKAFLRALARSGGSSPSA